MSSEPSGNSSDAWLARLAKLGDQEAFAALYRRFYARIYQRLIHIVRNHEEAQDLTQQTFLKVIEKLPTLKDVSRFSSWLYQIATNTAYDHLRAEKRRPWRSFDRKVSEEDNLIGIDEEDWNAEFENQVCTALLFEQILEEMPIKCQRCYRLHMAGWSAQAIARSERIQETSVKTYISQARQQLRRAFWPSEGQVEKKSHLVRRKAR